MVGRPRMAWRLAATSMVPVVLLTLVPQNRGLYSRCEVSLDWWWPTPSRVKLMANLVLFVAPVLFGAVATRRPLLALAVGTGSSAVMEAFQAVATPLRRSCDSNDLITNTMGAVIGAVLGWIALRLAHRRTNSV